MIYIFLLLAITQTNGQSAVCVFEGDGNGEVIGLVTLKEVEEGSETELTVEISGLSPGQHGFHIHQEGDLGNILAADDGVAVVAIRDPQVKLSGETSVIGRAIVVHEGTDDLGLGGEDDSLTTGHAGGRAGCCIIVSV